MPENQEKTGPDPQRLIFYHKPDEEQLARLEKNLLGAGEPKREKAAEKKTAQNTKEIPASSGKKSRSLNLRKGIFLLAALLVLLVLARGRGGKPGGGEVNTKSESVKEDGGEGTSSATEEDKSRSSLLRVMMMGKSDGYFYVDGDGSMEKLETDLIEKLSEDIGFEYETVMYETSYFDYIFRDYLARKFSLEYDLAFVQMGENDGKPSESWDCDFSDPYFAWDFPDGKEGVEYRIAVGMEVEDRDALISDINECLLRYQSDGTWDEWIEKWGLSDEKPTETGTEQTNAADAKDTHKGGGWVGLNLRKKMLEERTSEQRQQEEDALKQQKEELDQLSEQIQEEIKNTKMDLGAGSETTQAD